jgi:hypothetical protein
VTAIERDVDDDLSFNIESEASLTLKNNIEEFRRRLVVLIEESPAGVNACRFSANKTRTRPRTNIVDVVFFVANIDCSCRCCCRIIIVIIYFPILFFFGINWQVRAPFLVLCGGRQ